MAAAVSVACYRARRQITLFTTRECPYSLCRLKWNDPGKQILFLPPIGVIFNSKGDGVPPHQPPFRRTMTPTCKLIRSLIYSVGMLFNLPRRPDRLFGEVLRYRQYPACAHFPGRRALPGFFITYFFGPPTKTPHRLIIRRIPELLLRQAHPEIEPKQ